MSLRRSYVFKRKIAVRIEPWEIITSIAHSEDDFSSKQCGVLCDQEIKNTFPETPEDNSLSRMSAYQLLSNESYIKCYS